MGSSSRASVEVRTHIKKLHTNTRTEKMCKLHVLTGFVALAGLASGRLNFNSRSRSKREYVNRPYQYYTNRYTDRRHGEIKEENLLENLRETNKIIIDTRTEQERIQAPITGLNVDENAKYIVVAYDNFFNAKHFFQSFEEGSDFYDEANNGNDVNIFEGLPASYEFKSSSALPAEISELGARISLICGARWCGCRWNLMYDHGFRQHQWYDDDINDFIRSQMN